MSKKSTNTAILFITLFISISCQAQQFQWVKFFQGKNNQSAVSLSADSSGNQYSTFIFSEEITFDTINLKTTKGVIRSLVLKQNTDGKVIWYNIIRSLKNITHVYGLASKFDSKGNLIVFAASTDDIIVGTDTIKRIGTVNYNLYMLEFDKTGKMVNSKNLFEGSMNGTSNNLSYVSNRFVLDNHDNLYMTLIFRGQVKIHDSTGVTIISSSSPLERNIIFKFSNSGQKFEWANELPYPAVRINSLKVDIHENVYSAINWSTTTPIDFNGKTISNPQSNTGALFIWDKLGKAKNWFFIEASGKRNSVADVAVYDSNSIFISGTYVGDSAKFDTLWKKNNKYGTYIFFARYDINGKLKWVRTEDTSYTTGFGGSGGPMINYKDKYFYQSLNIAFHSGKPVIFGGQKFMPGINTEQGMQMKIDERGNILWGFRTFQTFNAVATDEMDNFYFQGHWSGDSIRFGDFKAYRTDKTGSDGFIGKTFDYVINRGNVNFGPYCAGDSVFVPYTKSGNFADTNIFFAEISDEFGNFIGKEREIGRLKSKNDGTIRGVLPMFKVSSSGKYRIRIRSTSPQTQSFYKVDTLRLLIYSRDKADPGPREVICIGDTIQLSTYGGTKWKWSPKYNMDDSTKRQPLVWPDKDTTYRIIISDSSGCGAPDTAYKKITVLESPRADFSFGTVCSGTNTNFKFVGTTPKSPLTTSFNWNFNNEGSSTLENPSYKFTAGGFTTLTLTSSNGCKDFLQKNIEIKTQALANFTTNDVCETDSVVFINKSKDATGYIWKFGDGLNNSTNSSILTQKHKYKITSSTTFNVTLVAETGNGCSDSIIKAVTVNANPKSDFTYIITNNNVDFKLTQSGNTAYTWYLGNGDSATGIGNFSYTYPNLSGKYTPCLRVINAAGCFSKTCKEISVSVGISAIIKPLGFIIYPNPNTGSFTIEIENPEMDAAIEVFDLMGKLVKKVERVGKVTLIDLDVDSGIYVVKVRNGGVVWNKKVSIFN